MKRLIVPILVMLIFSNAVFSENLELPRDQDGWTIFAPSSDTRIMYVSNDGDDSTGQVYSSDDFADPFVPSGEQAFATYEAAFAHARVGYPDWILIRRGDEFYDTIGSRIRSGRSATEPFLIGAYGNSGLSPLFKVGLSSGVYISKTSPNNPGKLENIAIQGIRFYSHTRNPEDPEYVDGSGSKGILIETYNEGNVINNILIEGCTFLYPRGNVAQAAGGADRINNISFRKNVFLNSYSENSHAQGIYASHLNNLVLEENIFDHNGWLIQQLPPEDRPDGSTQALGQATLHNHNVYINDVKNAHFYNNIFMRPSSSGTKVVGTAVENLVIDNNLYIDAETGIDSCNNYHSSYYRIRSPQVSNNVFFNLGVSRPTDRNIAWGMWIQGWDNGKIFDNLMIANDFPGGGSIGFSLGLRSRNLTIMNNTLYFNTSITSVYNYVDNDLSDVLFSNNYFEIDDEDQKRIFSGGYPYGISFENNTYHHNIYSPEFRFSSTTYTPEDWTSDFEPTAKFEKRDFRDPSRNVETYMSSLGETPTIEAFAEKCRMQDRYNWSPEYTAPAVNSWIKEGFAVELSDGCIPKTSCEEQECGIIDDGCSETIDCGVCHDVIFHDFTGLPLDKDGWTNFKHMIENGDNYSDSRVIFVSSSLGDDSTGEIYSASDLDFVHNGLFHPVGDINAFATITEANSHMRDGYPDILLLKRGDEWTEGFNSGSANRITSGRSAGAPKIVASYGDGDRPAIHLNSGVGFDNDDQDFIILSGIRFYADDWLTSSQAIDVRGHSQNVLIEDVKVDRHAGGIFQGGHLDDIVIRRCIFTEHEAHDGMFYAYKSDDLLFEENLFYKPYDDSYPDQSRFGRMVYLNPGDGINLHGLNVTMRRNIFFEAERGGIDGRSGGVMDNNLMCRAGIRFGANGGSGGSVVSGLVNNNVFTQSSSNLGSGSSLSLVNSVDTLVKGNVFVDPSEQISESNAITVSGDSSYDLFVAKNITLSENVIFNWKAKNIYNRGIWFVGNLRNADDGDIDDITVVDNQIQMNTGSTVLLGVPGEIVPFVSFSGNTYYSSELEDDWFYQGNFASWIAETGETGAQALQINYPDSSRTLDTYNSYLGGNASTEEFMSEALQQSRHNWREEYTANAANNYIREGFGVDPINVTYGADDFADLVVPSHDADTNTDGTIDISELNGYIQVWKTTSQIALADLIEVVEMWKNG